MRSTRRTNSISLGHVNRSNKRANSFRTVVSVPPVVYASLEWSQYRNKWKCAHTCVQHVMIRNHLSYFCQVTFPGRTYRRIFHASISAFLILRTNAYETGELERTSPSHSFAYKRWKAFPSAHCFLQWLSWHHSERRERILISMMEMQLSRGREGARTE